MSITFDPHALTPEAVSKAPDVLMTNPTALSELETYWASLPRKRGVPSRSDVDPVAMSGLLEDSFILERVAPGVARIRVAGRSIGKLFGVEPRGLPLTAAFLHEARMTIGQHLEAAFTGPNIVELELQAPRAVAQPKLTGKMLLLPLRDDFGRVSRCLGILVMSGRRGLGGRRFTLNDTVPARIEPIAMLAPITGGKTRPGLRVVGTQKAEDAPALRLVVSNP